MGNSTKTLQMVVDSCMSIGDIAPVITDVGGYSLEPAVTIASDVMTELISARFNWKWNRFKIPPFYTNSYQQDYASISLKSIGWLESCVCVDIGNTQVPKPTKPMEVVRDLPVSTVQTGWPKQICWLPNNLLEQGAWPGAGQAYTSPVGATQMSSNPPTNILDTNGNILILTTYGTTGTVAPIAALPVVYGSTIADGTCTWTVADPGAQGFRLNPIPAQSGNLWLIRPMGQLEPPQFTNRLDQKLDPVPDSYYKWWKDGFIAYCYRHSADPKVKARFPQAMAEWLAGVTSAAKQGDREQEAMGFTPTRSIMGETGGLNIGPAWPFGPGVIR